MSEKEKECPKGYILREGFERKKHYREEYTKCPPNQSGCKEGEKIDIPATIVKASVTEPTCVPDVGKKGKTPESEQWLPKLQKGGLSQYFDNEIMAYDKEACLKAGIRARKWGKEDKRTIQGRFRAQINLRSSPEKESEARKFRVCEKNVIIGFEGISSDFQTQEIINKLKKEIAKEP